MFGLGKQNTDAQQKIFDPMRFVPERALLESLFVQYSLECIIQHIHDSDQVAPFHQVILAQQLRLTPLLAPRVFDVLDSVRAALGFDEPTDLFVFPEGQINAFALHRLENDKPHVVSLTSEVIKSMTDDELRFTLRHELGHLGLRHYRVMMVQHILGRPDDDDNGQPRQWQMPQLLERRLDKWNRLAEISADRIGFAASGCDLSVAVSTFFKMASGLGPEHLKFDLGGFLAQLRELESLGRLEVMARFSHPATPVRARALQLYAEAGGPDASAEQLAFVDAEVDRITGLMDFELSTEIGVEAREFLLAGGLLAAHADGEAGEEEQRAVIQLLLQVTGDPESHFQRIKSSAEAENMLDGVCRWLRKNAGEERFGLFGQLCHVVCIDGVLTENERSFMLSVAKRLSIPAKSARDTMHQVLSGCVKTKGAAGMAAFGLRG